MTSPSKKFPGGSVSCRPSFAHVEIDMGMILRWRRAGAFEFLHAYANFDNTLIVFKFYVAIIHPRDPSAIHRVRLRDRRYRFRSTTLCSLEAIHSRALVSHPSNGPRRALTDPQSEQRFRGAGVSADAQTERCPDIGPAAVRHHPRERQDGSA